MAFITASGFAAERAQDGEGAAAHLARDTGLFLDKARIVNRYYGRAAEVYRRLKAREISRQTALEEKQRLFVGLEAECRALAQKPASFSSCPGAMNNAGLAFDYTYTKHYPLLYELFEVGQRDLRATLTSIREILARPLRNEDDFVAAVNARVNAPAPLGSMNR